MSPVRPPGFTARMPSQSARQVSATSRRAFGEASPTTKVREVSPCQPSTMGVTSTLTMSPSRSTCFAAGMPWQTTSLTEVQQWPGNGGAPWPP